MMAREVKTTVYTFAELLERGDSSAIERAEQWLREAATDHEWWEYVYDLWKEALAQIGFDDAEISFSGFSCQGDGACFTCKSVDLAKLTDFMAATIAASDVIDGQPEDFRPWIVKQIRGKATVDYRRVAKGADYVSCYVESIDHHYSHENTCRFRAYQERRNADKFDALLDKFAEDAESLRYDLAKAIYRSLEAEYDYRTSREALLEDAEANEYTFTASGKRFG